jgi:hypothetical protein
MTNYRQMTHWIWLNWLNTSVYFLCGALYIIENSKMRCSIHVFYKNDVKGITFDLFWATPLENWWTEDDNLMKEQKVRKAELNIKLLNQWLDSLTSTSAPITRQNTDLFKISFSAGSFCLYSKIFLHLWNGLAFKDVHLHQVVFVRYTQPGPVK